jgi:antitoxin (DNA-binding transcriptional repressor) of toxin-antitoxin stability system
VITDEKWPVARLIPISSATGVEAQERRFASAQILLMSAEPKSRLLSKRMPCALKARMHIGTQTAIPEPHAMPSSTGWDRDSDS